MFGTAPDPAPSAGGPAVVYLCPDDGAASTDLYTAWCERRAAADGWILTEVITDPDEFTPLGQRTGWQRITRLLADGAAAAVITGNRRMIADTPAAWTSVVDLLAEHGAALTTVTGTPLHAP
ncbi:hypothetical protein [Kitasatospora sp. NPDC094015]|uniref:hypothetical protein n=1 Tax=Kitasatospora sp. NPDC094015 TaxID=3155205 RepID=UPI00331CC19F